MDMSDLKEALYSDLSTTLLHADDSWSHKSPSVGVPISVSTTFRHSHPDESVREFRASDPSYDVYSRYTQPTMTRAEKVLGAILNGHALLFSSGLAAAFTALIHFQPDVIAIPQKDGEGGYHGCWMGMKIYMKTKPNVKMIDIDDDFSQVDKDAKLLVWLETPLNPSGECKDMQIYADKAHRHPNGKIIVDSTFGPPPLQDPFKYGIDAIFHSGTKYFSGHSDALIGVLALRTEAEWTEAWELRTYMGNTPGSLESWLILRSLRTLELRVKRQSETATGLAEWLNEICKNAPTAESEYDGCRGGALLSVTHASLQTKDHKGDKDFQPVGTQMTGGPACFSFLAKSEEIAKWFPYKLKLFVAATSLGGVESLCEHRITSDARSDPRLIRISVGLESLEDLKADFRQAVVELLKM